MSTKAPPRSLLSLAVAVCSLAAAPAALADWTLNMRKGVTEISHGVYNLHMLIFWVCVAIAVVVFGAMIVSIIAHRKSRGAVAAQFSHSATAEIVWTTIPVIILIAMTIPAAEMLVRMEDTADPDLTIKITGYQWKWGYEYIDHDVRFYSGLADASNAARLLDSGIDPFDVENYLLEVDRPLVVPQGAKVRLLITAADVLHAWWVPDFSIKKDAVPGYVTQAWFQTDEIGTYRGQCAELCGRDHGFMPVVVEVRSRADFDAWLADQKNGVAAADPATVAPEATVASNAPETLALATTSDWSLDKIMARGKTAYNARCASCHQVNGRGIPPTFPSLVDSAVVRGGIAAHIDVVLNGRTGTAMLPWKANLSDEDVASIITYQRNAWGIESGDVIRATDVKAARYGTGRTTQ